MINMKRLIHENVNGEFNILLAIFGNLMSVNVHG